MPHLANAKEKIPIILEKHLQGKKILDLIDGKVEYKNN